MHPERPKYIFASLVAIFCGCFVFIGYYTFLQQEGTSKKETTTEQFTIDTEQEDAEGSGCDYVSIVGDDICDDIANTEACAYDFGDCCVMENDRHSSCQDCFCFIDTQIQSTFVEIFCATPTSEISLKDLNAFMELGDGKCHLEYNQETYDFDLGDCCIQDVKCFVPAIDFYIGHGQDEIDCPQQLCIQSNTFCIQDEIGDGVCQSYNNVELCNYDAGDCCLNEGEGTICTECRTIDWNNHIGR